MIRLVHILTDLNAERERASISSLSPISEYGIEYVQAINTPYDGEDWKLEKNWCNHDHPHHGPRHYGAFTSFKKAVLQNFTEDLEALILCECDCILTVSAAEFADQVRKSLEFVKDNEISYYSFGYPTWSPKISVDVRHDHSYITDKIICAHCVMIHAREMDFIKNEFSTKPWETPDMWFNLAFQSKGPAKFGVINKEIAVQHDGESLIDGIWKKWST